MAFVNDILFWLIESGSIWSWVFETHFWFSSRTQFCEELLCSTRSNTMLINDLIEDAFQYIFEVGGFTLPQLLRLRMVSPKWNRGIKTVLSWRKSLKLFGSEHDIAFYSRYLIYYGLISKSELALKPPGQDDDLLLRIIKRVSSVASYISKTEVCNI